MARSLGDELVRVGPDLLGPRPGGRTVTQLLARTVLTELALRRGERDARQRLAQLAEDADRTGELQRMVSVLELETVAALLHGEPDAGRAVRGRGRPAQPPEM